MYSHVTVGTNAIAAAERFYDAVMGVLGHPALFKTARALAYGRLSGEKYFILHPFDGRPAAAGNGPHAAFRVEDRLIVDHFHRTALAHGGTDAGPPGLRPHYHLNYYAAYVRDPDGNKLQAVCHRAASAPVEGRRDAH